MDNKFFNCEKSIKNLANTDDKINMIIDYHKPKTKTEYDNKKRVRSILNEIRKSMLDPYTYHRIIFKLIEKYQTQRSDKVPRKYSKRSKSVG